GQALSLRGQIFLPDHPPRRQLVRTRLHHHLRGHREHRPGPLRLDRRHPRRPLRRGGRGRVERGALRHPRLPHRLLPPPHRPHPTPPSPPRTRPNPSTTAPDGAATSASADAPVSRPRSTDLADFSTGKSRYVALWSEIDPQVEQ